MPGLIDSSIIASIIALLFACAAARAQNPGDYKAVYIMQMSNGLDQFLAIKLTGSHVMQVVADPQKADAVFTDRIGTAFEQSLDELYGQKQKIDDKDKAADKDNLTPSTPRMASGSHGKGTIFLVDRKTRAIVWSDYVKPKNTTPDEMNHVAERIAGKLEKDRKAK
jgi:hypothetical protein